MMKSGNMIKPLVSGELTFAQPPQLPSTAVAYVHLLDTTLADAPSITVAEQVIRDIAQTANQGKAIPFALFGESPDPHASYNVSVHIDLDSDGTLSPGDYLTVQSYPVLTFGYPDRMTVQVKQVK